MGKPVTVEIIGAEELQRMLDKLKMSTARTAMREGSAAAAKEAERVIKNNLPSSMKKARQSIGSRRLKYTDAPMGGAKAGANVGGGKRRGTPGLGKRTRPGVGISSRNIWWWYRGSYKTPNRKTGKRGGPVRHTGRMPAQDNVLENVRKHRGALKREWQRVSAATIKREIARGF